MTKDINFITQNPQSTVLGHDNLSEDTYFVNNPFDRFLLCYYATIKADSSRGR